MLRFAPQLLPLNWGINLRHIGGHMKNTIKFFTIAFLTLAAVASFSTIAASGSMSEMIETSKAKISCNANCNTSYGECIGSATDLSLTSSAADILPRTKSNLMAGNECNTTVIQCYSAC